MCPSPLETLCLYLELCEQCLKALQKMPSLKFNKQQFQYLGKKLPKVVQSARLLFELFCAQFNSGRGSLL